MVSRLCRGTGKTAREGGRGGERGRRGRVGREKGVRCAEEWDN